jgi:predicted lipoprotein
MITDEDAEKCLNFIRDNAGKYAEAKAQTRQLDHYRKIKRSEMFLKASGTVAEREAQAEISEEYKAIVDGLAVSEETENKLKWQLLGAQAKLEAWRTMSANYRKATS